MKTLLNFIQAMQPPLSHIHYAALLSALNRCQASHKTKQNIFLGGENTPTCYLEINLYMCNFGSDAAAFLSLTHTLAPTQRAGGMLYPGTNPHLTPQTEYLYFQ